MLLPTQKHRQKHSPKEETEGILDMFRSISTVIISRSVQFTHCKMSSNQDDDAHLCVRQKFPDQAYRLFGVLIGFHLQACIRVAADHLGNLASLLI